MLANFKLLYCQTYFSMIILSNKICNSPISCLKCIIYQNKVLNFTQHSSTIASPIFNCQIFFKMNVFIKFYTDSVSRPNFLSNIFSIQINKVSWLFALISMLNIETNTKFLNNKLATRYTLLYTFKQSSKWVHLKRFVTALKRKGPNRPQRGVKFVVVFKVLILFQYLAQK